MPTAGAPLTLSRQPGVGSQRYGFSKVYSSAGKGALNVRKITFRAIQPENRHILMHD